MVGRLKRTDPLSLGGEVEEARWTTEIQPTSGVPKTAADAGPEDEDLEKGRRANSRPSTSCAHSGTSRSLQREVVPLTPE